MPNFQKRHIAMDFSKRIDVVSDNLSHFGNLKTQKGNFDCAFYGIMGNGEKHDRAKYR